jgi:hypothetical protein
MKDSKNSQKDFFNLWVYGNRLPKDYPLLQIKREVDFSFVDEGTKDLYSHHMGRPAYPVKVFISHAIFRVF